MLHDGRLHLSGIGKLAPHLTDENCEKLLARAAHQSKRRIEELVAEVSPRPDVPPSIRKLPELRAAASFQEPARELLPDRVAPPPEAPTAPNPITPRPAVLRPLAPARYQVSFTAGAELREKLERLQALTGKDLAAALEAAVTEKLQKLEAKRYARTRSPRKSFQKTDVMPKSRYLAAAVKRLVDRRDGGQCTFVDAAGRRYQETRGLEFHHHNPFGRGGSHDPEEITLRCRTHNLFAAEQDYGKGVMDRYRSHRKKGDRVSEAAPTRPLNDSIYPTRSA
jgi:hypothetical protein